MNGLKRYPERANEPLLAWDASDNLILRHMSGLTLEGKRILIVNDQFGALATGLLGQDITVYTDSYVSEQGIRMNTQNRVSPIDSLRKLEGVYDYVLIRMPKNMSFFEDILCHLTGHMGAGSLIICGAMVKHLAGTSFDLLQRYIGPTSTGLAEKKARLIFSPFEKERTESPYPLEVRLDGFEKPFTHHSNLFSREKLDIGTRFFLDHLPQSGFGQVLDLGCANGVVGIKAKSLLPDATVSFTDDSAMAIQSARCNYQKYFSDEARFFWTNCHEKGEKESADLVLCNPPFHQGNTIGDFIAWQMFEDAHRVLKKGGLLRIVGNSHLGYQVKLKKIFGNSKIVATNSKFMIVDAVKM